MKKYVEDPDSQRLKDILSRVDLRPEQNPQEVVERVVKAYRFLDSIGAVTAGQRTVFEEFVSRSEQHHMEDSTNQDLHIKNAVSDDDDMPDLVSDSGSDDSDPHELEEDDKFLEAQEASILQTINEILVADPQSFKEITSERELSSVEDEYDSMPELVDFSDSDEEVDQSGWNDDMKKRYYKRVYSRQVYSMHTDQNQDEEFSDSENNGTAQSIVAEF